MTVASMATRAVDSMIPMRTGPRSDRKPTPDDAVACSTLTAPRLGPRTDPYGVTCGGLRQRSKDGRRALRPKWWCAGRLHAGQRRAALRPVAGVLGYLGDPGRRAEVPGRRPGLPAGLSARDRLPQQVRLERREQVYLLLGSAPIEGRLSGVVDIPNSCATVYISTGIFDIDVEPSAAGPGQIDPGMGAPHSAF